MRKQHIAVIGSASSSLCENQKKLAYEVGKTIIECGGRLFCGGMGGVMEYSAKGAHAADNYQSGDVVGILPSYQADEANSYVDIPLTTGLGVARNAVLMAACDGVIVLDGGAGTLSEIAMAWQMKKPMACIGDKGWQHRLDSLVLDGRREDSIQVLQDITDVPGFIERIGNHLGESYEGIVKSKMSLSEMSTYLLKQFPILANKKPLRLLGSGLEGGVVTNGCDVYKLFYPNGYGMLLFSNLTSVAERLSKSSSFQYPFPAFKVFNGGMIVVSYSYFDSFPYEGGRLDLFVRFQKSLKVLGLCMSNLKAENFRITKSGELVCIDIGRDVLIYSDVIFRSSCKRAYITSRFFGHPQIKDFYRDSNDHDGFDYIASTPGIRESGEQLMSEYNNFYMEIVE